MWGYQGQGLFIVIGAVLLDLLLGDPRWLPHPVVAIGKLISAQERLFRQAGLVGRFGGILLLICTVGITLLTASGLLMGAAAIHPWCGTAVATLLAWTTLAARSLHRESKQVADALALGDLPGARRCLSFIVGRETAGLTEPEIWRGGVETVAENTADGVIAPLFYLILGGPALAMAYKAVNTLDSMVGYKNERYLRFGWASARCDDLANYLPARLTGLLMVLAAPLVGLSMGRSWRVMVRDGRNHSSPNSGIAEAAAAGALGVQLGGTSVYFGKPVAKPAIGDPARPLGLEAWQGAVRLMYGAEGLLLAGWLLLKTVGERLP